MRDKVKFSWGKPIMGKDLNLILDRDMAQIPNPMAEYVLIPARLSRIAEVVSPGSTQNKLPYQSRTLGEPFFLLEVGK